MFLFQDLGSHMPTCLPTYFRYVVLEGEICNSHRSSLYIGQTVSREIYF